MATWIMAAGIAFLAASILFGTMTTRPYSKTGKYLMIISTILLIIAGAVAISDPETWLPR